jgi:hypothetical protein
MKNVMAAAIVAATLLFAGPVLAQVRIEQPAPERPPAPAVIPPGDHYDATRPSDADNYPDGPRVRYDPTFVGPLSRKLETATGTGRVGVAGWASPSTPIPTRQMYRESTGWFTLGFAVEWGGPPPAKQQRPTR